MNNYATHKHPKVKAWMAQNPRIHVHFTPTSGSWLNPVEVWFGIIERQAIHRGTYHCVRDLTVKIRTFINGWNDRCRPFVGPNRRPDRGESQPSNKFSCGPLGGSSNKRFHRPTCTTGRD
jgi:hypothetical protein